MNTEKELIKALEAMDESEFDALLGDIELDGTTEGTAVRETGSDPVPDTIRKEPDYMISKKTRKRSAAAAILLAAAFLAAITAGAMGIGYLVNHKESIDAYFGSGAGDRIEQQGLFENVELAELEHLKITKETTLSTGCLTAVIVTVEATDETGREFIAGSTGIAFPEAGITDALGDSFDGWTVRPEYGDGYMTFMLILEYGQSGSPKDVSLDLYFINPGVNGDGIFSGEDTSEGVYLCTVNFSTEPNVSGKSFTGEDSGRTISLYDCAILSEQFVPLIKKDGMPLDITFEYADGTSDKLTDDDVALMHHYARDSEAVTDGGGDNADDAEAADTRLVFGRLIDSQNVEAVVISGERFAAN